MELLLPVLPDVEKRFALRVAFVVTGFLVLTTLFAYALAPKDSGYFGGSPLNIADNTIYFSYALQARETGHAFFWNVFTQEPSQPSLFNPLWAVVGYLSGLFHVAIPVIFHIIRLFSVIIFCYVLYRCLAVLVPVVAVRRLAYLLTLFGTGFGFLGGVLFSAMQTSGVDISAPSTTLMSFLHSPLFVLPQALLVLIITLFIRSEQTAAPPPRILISGLLLLLAIVHPYDVVTIFSLIGVYVLFRGFTDESYRTKLYRRTVITLLYMGVCVLPVVLYFFAVQHFDQGIGGWFIQHNTPSPSVGAHIIGYAPLAIAAIIGIIWKLRENAISLQVLTAWAVVVPIILYLPFRFQSRFVSGYVIALAVLGAPVIHKFLIASRKRMWLPIAPLLLVVCLVPSTLYMYAQSYRLALRAALLQATFVYPTTDFLAAAEWLRGQQPSVVLAPYRESRLLSALTLQKSFIADDMQTLNFHIKAQALRSAIGTPKAFADFLSTWRIRYYVETPEQRRQYPALQPEQVPDLYPVFIQGEITIYSYRGTLAETPPYFPVRKVESSHQTISETVP